MRGHVLLTNQVLQHSLAALEGRWQDERRWGEGGAMLGAGGFVWGEPAMAYCFQVNLPTQLQSWWRRCKWSLAVHRTLYSDWQRCPSGIWQCWGKLWAALRFELEGADWWLYSTWVWWEIPTPQKLYELVINQGLLSSTSDSCPGLYAVMKLLQSVWWGQDCRTAFKRFRRSCVWSWLDFTGSWSDVCTTRDPGNKALTLFSLF